jgi:hypothetical protein
MGHVAFWGKADIGQRPDLLGFERFLTYLCLDDQFCCDAQHRIRVCAKRNMPGRTAAATLQANRVCLPERVA